MVSLWAGTTGRLDDVPVEDIRNFEDQFLDYVAAQHAGVLSGIAQTKELSDASIAELTTAIDAFKRTFTTASGELLVKNVPVAALDESEVDQATITVNR